MECQHHHRRILFCQWFNLTMGSLILLVLSERSQLQKLFLQDDILNSMVEVIKGLVRKYFSSIQYGPYMMDQMVLTMRWPIPCGENYTFKWVQKHSVIGHVTVTTILWYDIDHIVWWIYFEPNQNSNVFKDASINFGRRALRIAWPFTERKELSN